MGGCSTSCWTVSFAEIGMPTRTLYELPGVFSEASSDDVQKAYRVSLAREYHPG